MHEASVVKHFLSCVQNFQISLWFIVIVPRGLSYFVGWVSVQGHSSVISFTSPVPQNSHNAGNAGHFTIFYIIFYINCVSSQDGGEREISYSKHITESDRVRD
jgi:hypothetical protein